MVHDGGLVAVDGCYCCRAGGGDRFVLTQGAISSGEPPWCLAKGLHEIGSRKEVLGKGKGGLSSRARLPGSRSTVTLRGLLNI